ncbi:MAG TPA: hypothetical protein DDX54_03445 [Rhodospirillaceae bacterium]|jgi:cytochrome b561|nr:cytochrome b/b6 domain-containing protein [Alphaproteobacteria bacterium]HBH26438.1 hypothetical protein [Rhodospirillaceae bacterium]
MSQTTRYPQSARVAHWATAGLVALQAALGLAMESLGPLAYLAHLGVGCLILALTLWRLALRRAATDWPEAHGGWPARVGHGALYALLMVVPLAGLAAFVLSSHALAEVHEWCAFCLLALVAGHVGMVAWHRYAHGVHLLQRMV